MSSYPPPAGHHFENSYPLFLELRTLLESHKKKFLRIPYESTKYDCDLGQFGLPLISAR